MMNVMRWIYIGMLFGILSSWLIGDELIGAIVCILFIVLNEVLFKFAKRGKDE